MTVSAASIEIYVRRKRKRELIAREFAGSIGIGMLKASGIFIGIRGNSFKCNNVLFVSGAMVSIESSNWIMCETKMLPS